MKKKNYKKTLQKTDLLKNVTFKFKLCYELHNS